MLSSPISIKTSPVPDPIQPSALTDRLLPGGDVLTTHNDWSEVIEIPPSRRDVDPTVQEKFRRIMELRMAGQEENPIIVNDDDDAGKIQFAEVSFQANYDPSLVL